MPAIEIKLEDLPGLMGRVAGQLARLDFTEAWQDVKLYLLGQTRKRFRDGRSPSGQPWAPVKIRARGAATAAKPLVNTGLLLASVTGGPGFFERRTPTSLTIGTNNNYAATHQFGATIRATKQFLAIPLTPAAFRAGSPRRFSGGLSFIQKRGSNSALLVEKVGKSGSFVAHYLLKKEVKIPARPFLGFEPGDAARIGRILFAHLARLFGRFR